MKNFWQKLYKKGQPILALAPMAGITDSAFRELSRSLGADVVYTEMISADGLHYDSKKTLEMLKFTKKEKPIVVQLFGKRPEMFVKAAAICEQLGFDGIDINFGCPAKKVTAHGGGVTLMRDLPKCREIIEAVLKGSKLPISIKIRSSINKGEEKVTALDFLNHIYDLPISAVMIHGRSYEKPFEGEPDYEMIKAVTVLMNKKSIPVLGNGGIKVPEEAKKMIELTSCQGVGLARGLYGKPWLFKQIKELLKKGKYREMTKKEIIKIAIDHAKLAEADKGAHGLIEMRKHLLWYVSGWPNAREMRSQLVKIESFKEAKKVLKGIL